MKVLIVSTSDIDGGAARAAYRLHKALCSQSIDSQMLVQDKSSDDYTVHVINNSKLNRGFNIIRQYLDVLPLIKYKKRTKTYFSPSWINFSSVVKKINEIQPDIVHLHWINKGMIKIEELAKIKAPIVWSLHDMWAFTGGCHYDEECGAYKNNCGNCKVLCSSNEKDLSRDIWNRKKKTFLKIDNLTIVGLSMWLSNAAKNSTLLKDKKHLNLANPIDTDIFKPFDKKSARELWSLPTNKKLILFGAMSATGDPRKGFNELKTALRHIKDNNIEIVIFGSNEPKKPVDFGLKTYYVGSLSDDISLITLYSAVDVMLVPSLQENLSNVIMESLACGVPVVGFDIGGNSDMIKHKFNGYLAQPFNTTDLANGLEWILKTNDYEKMCINARKKVLQEFDSQIIAKKYINLYKEVVGGT